MLNFLPKSILKTIEKYNLQYLFELRLRVDKPLYVGYNGKYLKENLIINSQLLQEVFLKACSYSVYAYSNSIKNGYVTTNYGVRVGIAGEYVYEGDKIVSVKNISSLVIRIPHIVKGCSKNIEHLFDNGLVNLFIVSPPGLGKTTLIKDIIAYLSNLEYKVVVIDEKNELYNQNYKEYYGNCVDYLVGIKKVDGIKMTIKNLMPDVIVLDELSEEIECKMVCNATNSGVKVITSTHAKNFLEISKKDNFSYLIKEKVFDYYVFLGEKIGQIKEVVNNNGKIVAFS